MLFNSISFGVFLTVVFILYWFVTNKNLKLQNLLLLVSSYYFYACWDYRFLFLLIFSTFLDYFTGIKMHEAQNEKLRKFWFWLSISVNLGFLGYFKYYNFFINSFANALSDVGIEGHFSTLQIILPVGISFYTFHGLSYIIDIYKKKIVPEKDFIQYSVFVSFFPLLVAGPIERATHLLPQIQKKRVFDASKAADGLRQIMWGLFKKLVIADNCAQYANMVFNNSGEYAGSTHFIGMLFFTMQIYGDFSGYSDIALGTARLFGIDLLRNFAFPFFSRDIPEFWRRWHISLSSWFRDYVYIPLGGNTVGTWKRVQNTFIIFIIIGFWHGANWTFILWGFVNALYIMPYLLFKVGKHETSMVAEGKVLPSLKEAFQMVTTFTLASLSSIFFRSKDITQSFQYFKEMFSASFFNKPEGMRNDIVWIIILFLIVEWAGRENQYALEKMGFHWPRPVRLAFYYVILTTIFLFAGTSQQFVYFQF